MKILVSRRTSDYVAFVEGRGGRWEQGDTAAEAVLRLIQNPRTQAPITVVINETIRESWATPPTPGHRAQQAEANDDKTGVPLRSDFGHES